MNDYTINYHETPTATMAEVRLRGVVQRRAVGGNSLTAQAQLRIKLRCEAETGQRAQEILEFLETEENSNVAT
jgi:hypothetical protein